MPLRCWILVDHLPRKLQSELRLFARDKEEYMNQHFGPISSVLRAAASKGSSSLAFKVDQMTQTDYLADGFANNSVSSKDVPTKLRRVSRFKMGLQSAKVLAVRGQRK